MKKRRLVALVLAMTMMMSSTVLVHAADKNTVNGDTTNGEKTVSSIVKTSDSADGSAASAFIVAVPANVTLVRDTTDPTKFKATYNVGVKGVLASGKYVSVTPAASFEMTGNTPGTKVTATVTQTKTKWVDADKEAGEDETVIGFNDYAEAPGNISVYIQKADVYTGTLGFTVKLN